MGQLYGTQVSWLQAQLTLALHHRHTVLRLDDSGFHARKASQAKYEQQHSC
jgi:hypothetical protein